MEKEIGNVFTECHIAGEIFCMRCQEKMSFYHMLSDLETFPLDRRFVVNIKIICGKIEQNIGSKQRAAVLDFSPEWQDMS